jgi:hypothetical protein
MTTPAVLPVPIQQFMDDNGVALANGLLYCYEAGTAYAILQPLYQDADLVTEYANPITLNTYGRLPGPAYPLLAPSYDFILKDANGVTIWTA